MGKEAVPEKTVRLRRQLLEWYGLNRRDLPWRRNSNPYAIWVSEVMLQQTRVAVVIERYKAFLARFPTLVSLALAPEQDVLALWSGLGYYRRARMLHQAAKFVAERHQGNLPTVAAELRKLPGIGAYTAAAIASIAHGEVDRRGGRQRGARALPPGRMGGRQPQRRGRRTTAQNREPGWRTGRSPAAGRFQPGAHGTGRDRLPAAQSAVPGVPAGRRLHDPRRAQDARPAADAEPRSRLRPLRAHRAASQAQASREVLLEQRPSSLTVMPGLWELPALCDAAVPEQDLRMTVRHAIMQVNYYVRIRTVFEDDVEAMTHARRRAPLDSPGQGRRDGADGPGPQGAFPRPPAACWV